MLRRPLAFVLVCLALMGGTAYAAAPNDPGWSDQWHLRTIHADLAWTRSRGAGVIVAVVDTGVDPNQEDLAGRLVPGANFTASGASTDTSDTQGHGTFMAGLIAADTGNRLGVASVAPLAKIMPIRVLNSAGTGDPKVVAIGIRYAADHGAAVINLSLAQEAISGSGGATSNLFIGSDMDQAINYAAKRALVVVAAGNNFASGGASQTSYTASSAGVLVVGASTKSDRRAAYSNYGAGLDVLAPGGGSASDPSTGACQPNSPVVSTWWTKANDRTAYGAGCGTSMGVAHVSGIGALLMARGYSNVAAANRIKSTAVDLYTPGRDDQSGYGRVDAAAAVGAIAMQHRATRRSSRTSAKRGQTVGAAGTKPAVKDTRISNPASSSPSPLSGIALSSARPYGPPQDPKLRLLAFALAMTVGVAVANTITRRVYASR